MYRFYKDKLKERTADYNYSTIFQTVFRMIFDYDDRIYRPEVMDWLLHKFGKCALIKTEVSEYTPVLLEFVGGERYPDGTFSTAICYDANGKQYQFNDWLNNSDICVVFNNPDRVSTVFDDIISFQLSELLKSENLNVKFSRLRPFPLAHNKQMLDRIQRAMENIDTGNSTAILSDFGFRQIAEGEKEEIPVLNLTDVSDSEKIQYLSHYYDNLISRFYFFCGVGMSDNGKQAQISTDELNRNNIASFILPLAWLKSRKECLEKFGLTVEFSELWKNKYDEILNSGKVENNVENVETVESGENNVENSGSSE